MVQSRRSTSIRHADQSACVRLAVAASAVYDTKVPFNNCHLLANACLTAGGHEPWKAHGICKVIERLSRHFFGRAYALRGLATSRLQADCCQSTGRQPWRPCKVSLNLKVGGGSRTDTFVPIDDWPPLAIDVQPCCLSCMQLHVVTPSIR